MTAPFMRAYSLLLIRTCHRRGAHAMGGAPLWGVILNRARPDRHSYDYGPYLLPASLAREGRRPLAMGPARTDHDSGGRFH